MLSAVPVLCTLLAAFQYNGRVFDPSAGFHDCGARKPGRPADRPSRRRTRQAADAPDRGASRWRAGCSPRAT